MIDLHEGILEIFAEAALDPRRKRYRWPLWREQTRGPKPPESYTTAQLQAARDARAELGIVRTRGLSSHERRKLKGRAA